METTIALNTLPSNAKINVRPSNTRLNTLAANTKLNTPWTTNPTGVVTNLADLLNIPATVQPGSVDYQSMYGLLSKISPNFENQNSLSTLLTGGVNDGTPVINARKFASGYSDAGSMLQGLGTNKKINSTDGLGWVKDLEGLDRLEGMDRLEAMSSLGGLMSLLSDRRHKQDIEKVGRLDNGLAVYRYRYDENSPVMLGVMADEVKAVKPEAVDTIDGVDYVNYGRL